MPGLSRHLFINKIRELGYRYKQRCKSDKHDLWKLQGGTQRIHLPRTDVLAETFVIQTLRQCKQSNADIQNFFRDIGYSP